MKRFISFILSAVMAVTLILPLAGTTAFAAGRFSDVNYNSWMGAPISWAVEKGVTSGISPNTFGPNDPCTRAQVITFLYRCSAADVYAEGFFFNSSTFSDVDESSYFSEPVAWAVYRNIVSGTGNNQFNPDRVCSRSEAVTFLWRFAGSPRGNSASNFVDVPSDSYYAEAVNWAVARNITDGTGNGHFSPNDPCTRGQVVAFLYRYYQSCNWKDSYRKTLQECVEYMRDYAQWGGFSFDPQFSFIYVDDDDIPEIMVRDEGSGAFIQVVPVIFTSDENGFVAGVNAWGPFGNFRYAERKGLLEAELGQHVRQHVSVWPEFGGGKIGRNITFNGDPMDNIYKVNNNVVSQQTYNQELARYQSANTIITPSLNYNDAIRRLR